MKLLPYNAEHCHVSDDETEFDELLGLRNNLAS